MAGVAPEDRAHPEEDLNARWARLDLSIIIVGYESAEPLGECLRSLERCSDESSREIIVVDNASSDETVGMIRRDFPAVELIENSANVGLSRAVNRGIRASNGRYVLVLNPDIVVRSGGLDALVAFMDATPEAGLAGAKLLNSDGSLQHSCRGFYTFWTLLLRRTVLGKVFRSSRAIRRHLMLDFDHESPLEVDWVLGACMIVRRSAMADVGAMDERFFLYFEDVDWCYRMWRGGWSVWYVPSSVMEHGHARESARPGINRLLIAHLISLLHFYEKWGGIIYRMKKHRRILLTLANVLADLVAINGGFLLAYGLRANLQGLLTTDYLTLGTYYPAFVGFANIAFLLVFAFLGLYSGRRVRESGAALAVRIIRASAVTAVLLMASTFLTSTTIYSRVLVGTFCILVALLDIALRGVLRWMQTLARAGGFDLTRVVIVGTDRVATQLAANIAGSPELGYDLVGLVTANAGNGGARGEDLAVPLVGSLDELPELIDRQRIEEVIFADPGLSSASISDFLIEARRSTVEVKMLSDLTSLLTRRARVEEFLDVPIVAFEREALLGAQAGVKRLIDILAALLLLILTAPFVLAAALVCLVARGRPLFERHRRVGLGGEPIAILGLRRQETPGALRRFVTRHGLDRVPELWDVIAGRMSLVGPAPLTETEAAACSPRERVRFDARPGVTGLARVAGSARAVQDTGGALDAYYVQNWSLGGDVRIAMRWLLLCLAGRCSPPTDDLDD